MLKLAVQHNIKFINHYRSLKTQFQNHTNCRDMQNNTFLETLKLTIRNERYINSTLGTYCSINPTLETPIHDSIESERILITKYRTGSHNLKIETGRWFRKDRSQRLCDKCNLNSLQTITHVLNECPFTSQYHFSGNLSEFFESKSCIETLLFLNKTFVR